MKPIKNGNLARVQVGRYYQTSGVDDKVAHKIALMQRLDETFRLLCVRRERNPSPSASPYSWVSTYLWTSADPQKSWRLAHYYSTLSNATFTVITTEIGNAETAGLVVNPTFLQGRASARDFLRVLAADILRQADAL